MKIITITFVVERGEITQMDERTTQYLVETGTFTTAPEYKGHDDFGKPVELNAINNAMSVSVIELFPED